MKPTLVRGREMWWPTWWGWALLVALVAASLVGIGRSAYDLLAPESPAPGARTLVVEGWLGAAELAQAASAARRGRYERVLTSGGPIDPSIDVGGFHDFAHRAAARLRAAGLVEVPVVAVPAPGSARERSYVSAVRVREWLAQHGGPAAVDVFSAGVHARRSWLVYRMALGTQSPVGILAAHPVDFDGRRWWTSSAATKLTLGEAIGLGWTTCCFWPGVE